MQVGDLVWSLTPHPYYKGKIIERRLAIILALDCDDYNPYIVKLVACGKQGKTSRKYLEPLSRD